MFSATVSHFLVHRERFNTSALWEVDLTIPEGAASAVQGIIGNAESPVLDGVTNNGRKVRIPITRWLTFINERQFHAEAQDVIFMDWPEEGQPARQHLAIRLSPTRIALPEKALTRSYTGEIFGEDNDVLPKVTWQHKVGSCRLVEYVEYHKSSINGRRATVTVPRAVITVDVSEEFISADARRVIERITNDLRPVLSLLSYLCRCHVRWEHATLTSYGPEGAQVPISEVIWERAGVLSQDERSVIEFMNPYRMGEEGLPSLVASLEASAYKEVILSAMHYLASGYQTRFAESRVLFGFTALETLVNGIHEADGTHEILKGSEFKEVRSAVKAVIKTSLSAMEDADVMAGRMIRKISELNRPPLVDQVLRLVERYSVVIDDLWPPDTVLADNVRALYARRSAFLHTGEFPSIRQASVDATRAMTITERLAYAMIEGKQEWLDPQAYEGTAILRRVSPKPQTS